jgi:DNA-binding transcriptional ArsR family regulator
VISFRFAAEDLLRVRFAISPLFELTWSISVLVDPGASALHDPWARAARRRLGELDLTLLGALLRFGRGYVPDFLSPPPEEPAPTLAGELERVLAVPPERVAREVGWRVREHPASEPILRPLLRDPAGQLPGLVAQLRAYWERAVAPWWPQLRAVLEADVDRRSRALARGGAEALFRDLHPDVAWHAGALEVRREYAEDVVLGGRGLLLLPSAFAWPNVFAITDEPWQPSLVYTPRAVGGLWAPAGAGDALRELLGPRRADVLVAIGAPTSTSELAERLGASPASVSEHLGVLRRAGLAQGSREGRVVRYRRTRTAEVLIRAARDAPTR